MTVKEEKRGFKFVGKRIILTLTQLHGLFPGTPTKHVLVIWEEGERPWNPKAVTIPETVDVCGMEDCNEFAVELLDIGLPGALLAVCVKHGLMRKIRRMFWDYDIGVSSSDLEDFIRRMMAVADER